MQSETFCCCERIGNLLNVRAPILSNQRLNEWSENTFLTCICGNLTIDVYSKDLKNLFSLFDRAEEPVAKKPRFYESPPVTNVGDLMQSDQPTEGDWVRFIAKPFSDGVNGIRVVKVELATKSGSFGDTSLSKIIKKLNTKVKEKFGDDFVNPPFFVDWAQRMTRYDINAKSMEDYAGSLGFQNLQKYPHVSFQKEVNPFVIPSNFLETVPEVNEKIKFRLWVMPDAVVEFGPPFGVLRALGFLPADETSKKGLTKAPDGSLQYIMKNPTGKYEVDNAEYEFPKKNYNINKATYLKAVVKINDFFDVTEEFSDIENKNTVTDSFDFIKAAVETLAKQSNRKLQVSKVPNSDEIVFDFPKLANIDYSLEFSPSLVQKLGLSASIMGRGAPNATISIAINPNQIYESSQQNENVANWGSHHAFLAKKFDLLVSDVNSRRETCANLKGKLTESNDSLAQIAMSISKLSTSQKNKLMALENRGQTLARLNKKFSNEVDNADYEIDGVRGIKEDQENVTLESNEKLKAGMERARTNLDKLISNLDIASLESDVSTFESDVNQFEDVLDTSEQKKLGKAIINALREKASLSSRYYLNNKATLDRVQEISQQLAKITDPSEAETKISNTCSSLISEYLQADLKIADAQKLITEANTEIVDVLANNLLNDDEITTKLEAIREEKTSSVDAKLQESKSLVDNVIFSLSMLENAWLSYKIEKVSGEIRGKLTFADKKYNNYSENTINGLRILKSISGDASLAVELSQLKTDLGVESSNQVKYETLAKEFKEELENVDRLRATPTAAFKKIEKVQQGVDKLLDDLNASAETASDLLNKCKALKIRSDVVETKNKLATVNGLEVLVRAKMEAMQEAFDDLTGILGSIDASGAMSANTRKRFSAWKKLIANTRKAYSSNVTRLDEIRTDSKTLTENIRTVPTDMQISGSYYNTGESLETSIKELNNWTNEHEPDVFFDGLETEGNLIIGMISAEEQDRTAAKALLDTKQGSIVNDLEGVKAQLEGLSSHLLDPSTIVPAPDVDSLNKFQKFCKEQADSILALTTKIQNLESEIFENEQVLTKETLTAWEGEKNKLGERLPTLKQVDSELKNSFATFEETARQQQATINGLKSQAEVLLKWFNDESQLFMATKKDILDEIARINDLLINGLDIDDWETKGQSSLAELNTLMQSQRSHEEILVDSQNQAGAIATKTDIDEMQNDLEALDATKTVLQSYEKSSAEKIRQIKESLSDWKVYEPPTQLTASERLSRTINNPSRSELAKRDSLGFARKARDNFQYLIDQEDKEEFSWKPNPTFKPHNYASKEYSNVSKEYYRESGFDEPNSPEPEIEIPIPPREPEISEDVPVLGWKGLPTSYTEMVCQYVNSIGYVYACLENYAGGNESNFFGKLFFVLIPDGPKWKLLDNPSTSIEPFHVSGTDLRKVARVNPMQVRLYHHDKEGKLVALDDDIPKRFEGLFHFCSIDTGSK